MPDLSDRCASATTSASAPALRHVEQARGDRLVLDLGRVGAARALDEVLLVLAVAALEEPQLGVALVGDDVRRDAVEEPSVVADADRGARPILDRRLQGSQGVDVEVVGGLVEHQHVAAEAQRLAELEAIPLTSTEGPDLLALLVALEVEPGAILVARALLAAEVERHLPARELIEDRGLRVEILTRLVHVHGHDILADRDRA
mmetsp:Transcript_113837/g.361830  ORF Transcript_113837/g.361830 Transcript_113837/m.361830 type:complete len:203 (-) Transcript_113837:1192-1800(-)